MILKIFKFLFFAIFFIAANCGAAALITVSVLYQRLPELSNLVDYRPRLPMRVYSSDGVLLGEFGEERRQYLRYNEFPPLLINALLATEDARFFEHYGVDFIGVGRAALGYAAGRREGASTITMQVARNFYLRRDRTPIRKLVEILLALKIENTFAKHEILERYLNQIYLGHGSYGFSAAAEEYYGKSVDKLDVAEIAILVGMPKAPSTLNPRSRPARAKSRQKHVLKRMYAIGLIENDEYSHLLKSDLPPLASTARKLHGKADFVAEEVRKIVFEKFGDSAYERGINVYTTISAHLQNAATKSLRQGLIEHSERQAYPGAEEYFDTQGYTKKDYLNILKKVAIIGNLQPAIIYKIDKKSMKVIAKNGERHTLGKDSLKWVRKHMPGGGKKPVLRQGALVRLRTDKETIKVTALPGAQSGFVVLSSDDGAVLAMVGGFDFINNKYNNVTQASRQPGSAIKPFFFSAALEKGMSPANKIPDAPIYLTPEETGSKEGWQPKNYNDRFSGSITMRRALSKSKNLATIHLTKNIGLNYARDYLFRFGFKPNDHGPFLTTALGAGSTTPLELATAYAVFANGGYLVRPYFISRIEDYDGNKIVNELDYENRRVVIDRRNAYIMTSMLQSVISEGTGIRAKKLGRRDLSGKTGTTNDTRDAWFAGYGGNFTAVSWVGYPQNKTLGKKETGSRAALPIWLRFMEFALDGVPEVQYEVPVGIIVADVDAETGEIVLSDSERKIRQEYFYSEFLPTESEEILSPTIETEDLF